MGEHSSPLDTIRIPLDGRTVRIGREQDADIVLPGAGISRFHATIECNPKLPKIRDNQSSFGIVVNGLHVAEAVLLPQTELVIGIYRFIVTYEEAAIIFHRKGAGQQHCSDDALHPPQIGPAAITIGRDPHNSVCLQHPLISRLHATLTRTQSGDYSIVDHSSTNGTFVNGKRVQTTRVFDGDIIQIGSYRFVIEQNRLVAADHRAGVELEAFAVTVTRGSKKIVDSVSLTVKAGTFVALLGPSGAGKTSLACALAGQSALTSGEVYLNGFPLSDYFQAFSSAIGFVTQHNLIRDELTVAEIFDEQAILRLPHDSAPAERKKHIDDIFDLLELGALAKTRAGKLSGGEAKRVHLGIELLSSPSLLFLDEPLAGLDPGLIDRFMKLFRKICDRGHTLILTTHILEQIDLCDRVVFMAGGQMVYEGPVAGIYETFGATTAAQIYDAAREGAVRQTRPKSAGAVPHATASSDKNKQLRPHRSAGHNHRSVITHSALLLGRYIKCLVRDTKTAVLLMLQAPVIALLLSFVYSPDISFFGVSFYFCCAISAVWIGGVCAIREVARELPLVNRDYRACLSVVAYTGAKIAVNCCMAAALSVVFLLFIKILFLNFPLGIADLLAIAAAGASGALLGLCISSWSPSVNVAVSLLPVIFMPQIFFAGILMPFDQMTAVGQAISFGTVTRHVFGIFKKIHLLDIPLIQQIEWRWLALLDFGVMVLMYAGVVLRLKRGVRDR